MEPRVVQDSDDEASDGGLGVPPVPPIEEGKGTTARLIRKLQEAHAKMLEEEAAHSKNGAITGETGEVRSSVVPTISVQREQSYGNVSIPGLTTSETISSDHTTHQEAEDVEGESQKRKADVDLTDEDEVLFVPARKKQRGDTMNISQPTPNEVSNRASMPPPSQESIASRASATSQRSALRVQPSPPRLQDNMSFTTTNSSATSFQGSRGARMFPSLESDSFQERLNNMDLDPETEPDSMPASQDDPTVTAPRPMSTQDESISSSLEGSGKSNGDTRIKNSPQSSDIPARDQATEPLERSSRHNGPPLGFSSTMVRVEVPIMQSGEEGTSQDNSQEDAATSRDGGYIQNPMESPVADGDLADGEENAEEDTIKLETKQKTKKSKTKKAGKRRGRPPKKRSADIEESGSEEEGVAKKRNGTDSGSLDSKKDSKNRESATTSNATSFVADTPSPELEAGVPVSVPEAMPGTPDGKSDGGRSGKHSPLNNGRVPLRVGLSKRVPIEPLLRTVRK